MQSKRLTTILSLISFYGLILESAKAYKSPGYSHEDSTQLNRRQWMANFDDKRKLNTFSLPGTHNTMANSLSVSCVGDIGKCQTLSLESQLQAGIRVLDIRARYINECSPLRIQHGPCDGGLDFVDILSRLRTFLSANPTETMLMRLKEEESNNATGFEEKVYEYYLLFKDIISEERDPQTTLGNNRGKILLLKDFNSDKIPGLRYADRNFFNIQDHYNLTNNWGLYDKWTKVKDQLNNANRNSRNGLFYINYLSANVGSLPYFVASGHVTSDTSGGQLLTGYNTLLTPNIYPDFRRVNCLLGNQSLCSIEFIGTNILTYDYLNNSTFSFVGIIMSDFPGDGLIRISIDTNLKQ